MEITERRTADIVTLSLSGKLDTTTAKAFEEKILSHIESGDRRFIIDLARLDYISSSGLRVLVSAAKRLANDNGKIVLCSLKDPVREVFKIVGFLSVFPAYGSHDEAISNLWPQTMSALESKFELRQRGQMAVIFSSTEAAR